MRHVYTRPGKVVVSDGGGTGAVAAAVAAVLAVAAASALLALIEDIAAALVSAVALLMVAGTGYLVRVLRRDGLWVVHSGTARPLSAKVTAVIEPHEAKAIEPTRIIPAGCPVPARREEAR